MRDGLRQSTGTARGTGQRGDRPGRRRPPARAKQQDLDSVIRRIKTLTAQVSGSAGNEEAPAAQPQPHTEARRVNDFLPVEPESFRGAGLTETMVESLVLKFLLARGDSSGREIADQVKLPFILIDELLRSLKNDQMVTLRGSAAMNDFQYQLSDLGRERARRYVRTAPISAPPRCRCPTTWPASRRKRWPGSSPRPSTWPRPSPICC